MGVASDDDGRVRGVMAAADRAATRGEQTEADRLFREVHVMAPHHPVVRAEAALRAMQAGNGSAALAALEQLAREAPAYPEVWFNLAVVYRTLRRAAEAIRALNYVLAIQPQNMPALLEKASIEEQMGDLPAAAVTYFAFLQLIPPGVDVPPALTEPLQRAQRAVEANNRALEGFLDAELAPIRARHAGVPTKRFERCVDLMLRKKRVFRQQPTFMFYPEMPAIEFYDRDPFPWLDVLEASAGDIRSELVDILSEGTKSLDPYLRGPAGVPSARSGDRRWRSYPFWREGRPFPEHMARCRRTMKALSACPHWDTPGMGPNAMFSILEPHTRIPPHTGTANTRVVAHLALIVPKACRFRVGDEEREWQPGKAFVFDDTIEHEAVNDSDDVRAILIVDVWSPYLSAAERDLLRAFSARMSAYYRPAAAEPAAARADAELSVA